MATENIVQVLPFKAGADLSTKQYYFVKQDASGSIVLCGAGEAAIGSLKDDPTIGETGTVVVLGVGKVKAGAAFGIGANLTSDAAGRAVTAGASDAVNGISLAAAGAANEIVSVLMVCRISAGSRQSSVVTIPIKLPKVANGDIVTGIVPGFPGRIQKVFFVVTDPVTTADKLATLNLEIGTTNLTGGVISLTSANCTPLGAKVEGTAITGNNVFTATDSISVEASAVTAFAEGEGFLMIVLG